MAALRTNRMLIPVLILAITAVVGSAAPAPAQTLPVRSTEPTRSGSRTAIDRVHRLDTVQQPLQVPNEVEVTGTIDDLPYNAQIRLAIRCQDDGPWRVIAGSAFVSPTRTWQFPRTTLVPSATTVGACDLIAFVADPMRETLLDDEALSAKAYSLSTVVKIVVDPRLSLRSHGAVVVQSVASQSIRAGRRLDVPWRFFVSGTSQIASSERLVPLFACGQRTDWVAAGAVTPGPDGIWTSASLSLPQARPGSECALVVIASSSTSKDRYTAEELAEYRGARSQLVELIQRPVYLSVRVITDSFGVVYVVDDMLRDRPTESIALNRDVATVRVASEPLPDGVKVFIALQPYGFSQWLLFGPLMMQQPETWIADNVRVVMTGVPALSRSVRAVASTEALHGRALSAEELRVMTLGVSEVVQVTAPAAPRCRTAIARLAQVEGAELAEATTIDAPSVRIEGELRHTCQGFGNWLGLRQRATGQWRLLRLHPEANGHWRETLALPAAERSERDPVRDVTLFVAPESFGSIPVDEPWLKAFAASEAPTLLTVTLPYVPRRFPWSRPAGSEWVARVAEGGERAMTQQLSIWRIAAPLGFWILAAITVAWAFVLLPRAVRGLRDWLNGRLDGRAGITQGSAATTPYENLLQHGCDEARARVDHRFKPPIDAMRRLVDVWRGELERLQAHIGSLRTGSRQLPHASISSPAHHSAFFVMTVSEVAWNLAAFRVLDEPDPLTVVMSLSVSTAFPVAAYFVGLTARRWEARTKAITVLLFTTVTVILIALLAINEIRIAHLSNVDPAIVQRHPTLHMAFVPVNLLIVFVTALLAFLRHDSVEGFAETRRAHDRLTKKIAKKEQKIAKRETRLSARLRRIDAQYGKRKAYYAGIYARHHRKTPPTTGVGGGPTASASGDTRGGDVSMTTFLVPPPNGNGHSTGVHDAQHL
jgi:hypothetical protein